MDAFLGSLEPWLIYLVIGFLTFGESAAFLGLVFPGEVALVAAAAVAGLTGVDPFTLAVVAAVAASAGGVAGYELGHRYGHRLLRWDPIARRVGPHIARVSRKMAGPGATALVVVGRFNQVTRATVPALAGMGPMSRLRFSLANAAGGIAWAVAFTAVGFYAAAWWRASSGSVQVIVAVVLAAAVGAWAALTRTSGTPVPATDEVADEVTERV